MRRRVSVSKNSLSFRGSEATVGIRTFKVAVFLKIRMKSDCFGERIATPVCVLARNDSFFDSLMRRRVLLRKFSFCFTVEYAIMNTASFPCYRRRKE